MPNQISASRYSGRRRNDVVAKVLAFAATAVGLGWLVLILGVLFWKGFSGLSVAVFTEMTPCSIQSSAA
jgi:phosphate transport system permease protein